MVFRRNSAAKRNVSGGEFLNKENDIIKRIKLSYKMN